MLPAIFPCGKFLFYNFLKTLLSKGKYPDFVLVQK